MKKKTVALLLSCVLIVGCVIGGSLAWLTAKSAEVKNVFTTSDINIELLEHNYDPETNTLKTSESDTPVTRITNYKMVPGFTLPKDPWVTVKAGSEKCYVFVQANESGSCAVDTTAYDFDDFLKYAVDTTEGTGWIAGTGLNANKQVDYAHNGVPVGVYFRVVNEGTEDQKFDILGSGSWDSDDADNDADASWSEKEVYVRWDVTKEMMNAMNESGAVKPTLTFTAYACQFYSSNAVPEDETDAHYDEGGTKFTPAEAWDLVKPNS